MWHFFVVELLFIEGPLLSSGQLLSESVFEEAWEGLSKYQNQNRAKLLQKKAFTS